MPGSWTKIASICSSLRTVAFRNCTSWADEGAWNCQAWADEGSNQCSEWADEGSKHCCTWWPCSWLCQAWYWVANWVCQAWYWVANWVCQAWYWLAKWVCLAWGWLFFVFCLPGNGGSMFLLTDGTVLMNEYRGGYGTRRWWKLTPDATGSYVGGTWTRVADSANGRKYFASAVMADGRLVVCGGEYSDVSGSISQDETSASEIYDPVANAWTTLAPPAGVTNIGDAPCAMLPDGRFLLGSSDDNSSFLLDAAATTWTVAGTRGGKGDSGSEETWVLMANGTVVVPQCANSTNAEMYCVRLDQWLVCGALAANIVEAASIETGPGLLLTDGRAFFAGSTGNTALYTAGANDVTAGAWAKGPDIPTTGGRRPQSQGAKDGPAVLLPSGAVLFPVAPVDGVKDDYLAPTTWLEFDGVNLNGTTPPPNPDCPTYVGRLLLLPTGQAMWTREDDNDIFIYTETPGPLATAKPVITAAPNVLFPGGVATVSGTQFNGLSQAVSYGDDYAAATNYPLVRVTNLSTGAVRFCRTANHALHGSATPAMGVATGAAVVDTQISIPSDLAPGPAHLVVIANGVASDPVRLTVKTRGG
jgi:hypothetical protein